jgi:hypothetical protein
MLLETPVFMRESPSIPLGFGSRSYIEVSNVKVGLF